MHSKKSIFLLSAWSAAVCFCTLANAQSGPANSPPFGAPSGAPSLSGPSGETLRVVTQATSDSPSARLLDRLQLNDAQMPAWATYMAKVEAYSRTYYDEKPLAAFAAESAPRQVGHLVDNLSNRLAALEDVEASAKALYALLSPAQQKLADQYLAASVPMFGAANAGFSVGDQPSRQNKDAGPGGRCGGAGMGGMGGM